MLLSRNMQSLNCSKHNLCMTIITFLYATICFFSSFVLSVYLHWQPEPLIRVLCFLLMTIGLILFKKAKKQNLQLRKGEQIALALFSFFLSVSIILGHHIAITSSGYWGTLESSYIIPYGVKDLIGMFFIVFGAFSIVVNIYVAFRLFQKSHFANNIVVYRFARINKRMLLVVASLIFLAWIPYLLAYWPGLIFGDSLSSLRQITGEELWNNHFPVVYTFLVGCCISLSDFLGFGFTTGCALYSIIQMMLMSLTFSYLCNWIASKFNLSIWFTILLAALFAFTPYVASYSIAMWKDPLFSCAIVILSLILADIPLTQGRCMERASWIFLFVVSFTSMALLRNNGIYIALLLCLAFLVIVICNKCFRKKFIKLFCVSLSIAACIFVLLGPIYGSLGIKESPKAESYGLFLNQMARVVAYDGEMSESDKQYMNEMLPLEMYKEVYTPACVDNLKWNASFNGKPLEDGSFFKHWLSMFVKNPKVYFESWEFQTFGYWTINQPFVLSYNRNMSDGVPRNTSQVYTYDGVSFDNLLGTDQVRHLLPIDEWSIPIGIINWLVCFLAVCLALNKKKKLIISLLPIVGLVITLLVASPLFYWPRYEAAGHFLLPFFIALFAIFLASNYKKEKDSCSSRTNTC